MNDFHERRPTQRVPGDGTGPGAGTSAGAGTGVGAGQVHQMVFRWDGNHGRQGTGMKAVAHSCSADRAEELGRELGPLLWVSGASDARSSVVRTLSQDGDVMLVQRWPTTDRGGRPSTVSHVLLGDTGSLKTRLCLGLAYGGWGRREKAEQAVGEQPPVPSAKLDTLARDRLPGMTDRLRQVRKELIMVTAEWLRDPQPRVSLRSDALPVVADQDSAPLVYLGLFLIFGHWLNREWTFATYDTVDTHPLRLTCVPRWEPDAGGSGPLARVVTDPPPTARPEHRAALALVDYLLAHPGQPAGVAPLADGLRGAAALPWPQREARLRAVLSRLGSGGTAAPRDPARAADPAPAPARGPSSPDADPRPTAPAPARAGTEPPSHQDAAARAPLVSLQRPTRAQAAPPPAPDEPAGYAAPPPDRAPGPPANAPATAPTDHPAALPAGHPAAAPPGRPAAAPGPDPAGPTSGPGQQGRVAGTVPLREDLHLYRHTNTLQYAGLTRRLKAVSDATLIAELKDPALPADARELLLTELRDTGRLRERTAELRNDLCAEVLRRSLYYDPNPDEREHRTPQERVHQAADLFTWAVAPVAHNEQHRHALLEVFHWFCRQQQPASHLWIERTLLAPTSDLPPNLPAALWQQIVRDLLRRPGPPPALPGGDTPPQPAPAAPTAPAAPADQQPAAPERPERGRPAWLPSLPKGDGQGTFWVLLAMGLTVVALIVLFTILLANMA
ncbi:hypothetical protein AB0F42_00105 [Streptomyces buecherae]|uniref:hypothetical protein n=1 Tax=Streptomyces buecherae TaxID=2763006 RepID=UPI0033E1146E